ncbi:MAG: GTP-binding protein [Promethearchaeota archaeon]
MDFKFKVVLLGQGAVGKTSLLKRYVLDQFDESYKATIGADFLKKDLVLKKLNNITVNLNIWDIAGGYPFKTMRKTFYRGSSGALLIFDLIKEDSFIELKNKWYPEMIEFLGDIPFIIVGNKQDLVKSKGTSASELAQVFAKEKGCSFFETSAKTNKNVPQSFRALAEEIVKKAQQG